MVHEDVDRHRERGEDHVLEEVHPEHDAEVQAELEMGIALERLDQEPADHRRGLERHDQRDQREESAGEHRPLGHRRRVHDRARPRSALLPHELPRIERDQDGEEGPAPRGEDLLDDEERHRPGGRVEYRLTDIPAPEEDEPDTRGEHHQEPAAEDGARERVARDGERLPDRAPGAEGAGDARNVDRPGPLGGQRGGGGSPAAAATVFLHVREPERSEQQREHRGRHPEPERAVPRQRRGQPYQPCVPLRLRPVLRQLRQRRGPQRVDQRGQRRARDPVHVVEHDDVGDEEADRPQVHRERLPREHPDREQDCSDQDEVGQLDREVRLDVGRESERADLLGAGRRDPRCDQDPQRDRHHDEGVYDQRSEEPPAEELRLADGGGEEERVHLHLDVAHRRLAEQRRGDEHAEHPDDHRGAGDSFRRVGMACLVGEGEEHQDRDAEEDPRVGIGRAALQPVRELVAEDLPQPHDAVSATASAAMRRPWWPAMTLK